MPGTGYEPTCLDRFFERHPELDEKVHEKNRDDSLATAVLIEDEEVVATGCNRIIDYLKGMLAPRELAGAR